MNFHDAPDLWSELCAAGRGGGWLLVIWHAVPRLEYSVDGGIEWAIGAKGLVRKVQIILDWWRSQRA